MRAKGMLFAATALGAAALACSTTTKPGEDTQRSHSADERGFGSPDQPNNCGSYSGDAAFILVATDGAQFDGRITSAGSPAQNGWFGPPFTAERGTDDAHSCDTPNPTSTVRDHGRDIHYNEVFLKNWTDADACVSVWGAHLDHLDSYSGWEVTAYVGSFDPNDVAKNNVAAWTGGVAHFSFRVPANAAFEIVVMAEAPYAPDGTRYAPVDVTWGINVANCGEMQSGGGSSVDGGGGSDDAGGSSSGGEEAGSSGGGKSW